MWIVKKRKLGVYLQWGVYGGKEWMNVIHAKENATPATESVAKNTAEAMNMLYRTDMWEATIL